MTELITQLIEIALIECHERGIIDWLPNDGMPESFQAEGIIESNFYSTGGDYFVSLFGVFTIIDAEHLEAWHSSLIEGES